MTTPNLKIDIWESNQSHAYAIQEAATEVDGKHILAKVVGPAFFPDSVSRNKVHYPEEAWINAIENPDFVARLQDRLVYGTIGHDAELNDNDIRDGKFSHIVTKVWIDEDNVGKAEYLVLNTPPGQVLNTLLRAGSKLRVSTKAEGYFENSSNRDGSKSVIPEKFILERIDFVVDPGYKQALPSLIESLKQSDNNPLLEESHMSEKVTEILESQVKEIKQEKQTLTESLNKIQEELRVERESNAQAKVLLENYKGFGTIASIQESLSELSQYQAIGSVQEIHEALQEGEETIDQLTDTLEQTKNELETKTAEEEAAPDYTDCGSPEEVKDALDKALTVVNELEQYRALGSVDELQQVITRANEMTEDLENQEVTKLASDYGVDETVIRGLSEKGLTLEEVEGFLASVKGVTAPEETPVVSEEEDNKDGEITPPTETPPASDDDEDDEPPVVSESMSSRLLQRSHKFARKIQESNKQKKDQPATLAARLMNKSR